MSVAGKVLMFKRDVIATFGGTVASTILGLATGMIVARLLGSEGRGLLALALLLPMVIDKFMLMGQDMVNCTFAGIHKEQRSSLFFHSVVLAVVGGGLSALIIVAFYFWLPIDRGQFSKITDDIVVLICFYTPLSLISITLTALLRGSGRVVHAAAYTVILSAANLILTIVLLWWLKLGIVAAVGIAALVPVISIALSIWTLRDYATLRPSAFSWPLMRKSLSFGGLISLSTLASFLIYRLDQGMLGYMVTASEVGLYVVAVSLAERLRMLPSAISSAFLPRLANEVGSRQGLVPAIFRQTLIISLAAMAIAGIGGVPMIYLLYGPEFAGSIVPFLILLPGIAALGGASILASDLLVRDKAHYSVKVSYSMLLLNVAINLLLIPTIGISGAAVASVISYVFAAILWMIFYCRESGNAANVLRPRWADVVTIYKTSIGMFRQLLAFRLKRVAVSMPPEVMSSKVDNDE